MANQGIPPRLGDWLRSQEPGVKAAVIGLAGTLLAAVIGATATLTVALMHQQPGSGGGAAAPGPKVITPAPATTSASGGTATTSPPATPQPTTPTPTPTPPPTATAPPPPPASRVRWKGTLVLDGDTMAGGWWLDDAPPQPSVAGDIYTQNSSGTLYSDAAIVAWSGSRPPTHDECAALLNTNRGLHSLDVRAGDSACVGTWDGRVGYVRVTSIPDSRRIDVTATVWERQ